ncbi:MAG TPA: cyclic nucleotide-binding domain-containing protein [Usitatibacter sp.]|nr:cyclic nucleotide-binding domain-containing protein [Usitatibacter sp.]
MGIKLDVFHNEAEGRSFAAGEKIFSEHEMGFEMYVVISGEVDLSINGEVFETLGPAEPFGEMALIDQAPRTATATAKTDCVVLPIPEKRFLFMVQQTPYFSLQIMKVMTDRLRRANDRRNKK